MEAGRRPASSVTSNTPSGPRVWKFTLPAPSITGRSFVDMPAVVEPLSVGMQDDQIVVWALVDPDAPAEEHMENHGPRRFVVANTGPWIVALPPGAKFLGTVTASNGTVWHIWDGDAGTTE